jgi:hypothetical protein
VSVEEGVARSLHAMIETAAVRETGVTRTSGAHLLVRRRMARGRRRRR